MQEDVKEQVSEPSQGERRGLLTAFARAAGSPYAPVCLSGTLFAGVLAALYFPIHELGLALNPTFELVDLLINYSPGAVATWAIETFGHLGKVLLTAAGVAVWMALGGVLAVAAMRLAGPEDDVTRASLAGGLAHAAVVGVIVLVGGGREGGLLGGVILLGASIGWGYASQYAPVNAAKAFSPPRRRGRLATRDRPVSRRAILTAVTAWSAAGAAGSMLAWRGVRAFQQIPLQEAATAESGEVLPNFDPNFAPAPGTRALVTTNKDFYQVDIMTRTPQINADLWRVRVHGLVRNELKLSYADLVGMEPLEMYATLQCVSNEVGGDLISTTRWKGVPLKRILEMAEPQAGAVDVVFFAEGGYHDSIPVAKAMEPETLLAYGMNGVPLPAEHGYPLRAYIPNIYGMKNVKWITEIKVVAEDHQGYWQVRGWSDLAIVKTTSAIDIPGRGFTFKQGLNSIGGIAFAGQRGINVVEYRLGNDGIWTPAELEMPLSKRTWRRWKATLDLPAGRHVLQARAVDGDGNPQDEAATQPHPEGASGYHSVRVTVEP